MEQFLNKEVLIYPGDTRRKTGIIKEINEKGVVFLITSYTPHSEVDHSYTVGRLQFISFSANLTFQLLK